MQQESANSSQILLYGLLGISVCCAPGGVRVASGLGVLASVRLEDRL